MSREGKSDGRKTERLDVAPPWKIYSEVAEQVSRPSDK